MYWVVLHTVTSQLHVLYLYSTEGVVSPCTSVSCTILGGGLWCVVEGGQEQAISPAEGGSVEVVSHDEPEPVCQRSDL